MLKVLIVLVVCLPLLEARNITNPTKNDGIACINANRGINITNKFPRYFAIRRLLTVYKELYSHVNVFPIGFSYEKRKILAIKFSTGNSSKKSVVVEAGIHAREWLTIASTLRIIERMATKYGADSEVNELINKYDWIFIPVLNPDGYEFSHTKDRLWRKNRRPVDDNCIGVDLNRNFDAQWAGGINHSNPCMHDYRGPAVNSELETQAIVRLVSSPKHQPIIAYFSIHNYGQLIIVPYGYTLIEPANGPLLRKLARSAAGAMKKIDGRTFTIGNGPELVYYYNGASADWAYLQGVKFTYTFELRPNENVSNGFEVPTTEIEPSYRELFAGLQAIVHGIMKLGY